MVMPSMGEGFLVAGAWTWPACCGDDFSGACFVANFFLVGFFAAGFFFGAGFFAPGLAGIGMVIPGMCMLCAAAGVETTANASALAAANNFIFTLKSPEIRVRFWNLRSVAVVA